MEPKKCDREGCGKEAVYQLQLSLACNAYHTPVVGELDLYVCEDHKVLGWDDVVSPEGWQKLREGFISHGKRAPERKFSKLVLVKLHDSPA